MNKKLISIFLTVLTICFIISFSVAVPLLYRPFYYNHIEEYNLTAETNLTEEQIKQTYDEIVDFGIGKKDEFSLTHFKFSQEGKLHFEDVKKLFILDLSVMSVSSILLFAIIIYCKIKNIKIYNFKGHSPYFYSGVTIITTFAVVAVLASVNFNRAFIIFHKIFFPGKTNWVFSYAEDPVISILPQEFFRNCAILILFIVITFSFMLILTDLFLNKHKK